MTSVINRGGVTKGLVSLLRPLGRAEDRQPSQRLDSSPAAVEAYSIEEGFQRRGSATVPSDYIYPSETISPYQVPQ